VNESQKRRVARLKRQARVRKKVRGTTECPRLSVFRSAKHIYAQIISPDGDRVLASASTLDGDVRKDVEKTGGAAAAAVVGKVVAERARAAGISRVAFDRSGFKYHGRVKALADAARESGLEF